LPYNISDHTLFNATWLIAIYGMYMPLAMFNMTAVVGVMRSGGDTRVCIIMDLIAVYFIGLPLAIIGAFILKLPVFIVYAMIYSQEIFKAWVMFQRFISKKWMNNVIKDIV
jgi:Na+-driven multidrug efflux pump